MNNLQRLQELQAKWDSYKDRLKKSYESGNFTTWGDLWADDGSLIVKYGKQREDGYQEEEIKGRDKIVSFFSGSTGKIEIDFRDDGPVYVTPTKPDTFFVISDFIATIIKSRDGYENRILCQVTLDAQGKIKRMIEYTDHIKRQNFLNKLRQGQAAASCARVLVAQHLRVIDRAFNQYDAKGHFIPTNVDDQGRVLNRTLGVMNQSRHLYGVVKAYEFTKDDFYLKKAKEMAKAYLERFVNESGNPPYFFEEIAVAADGSCQPTPPEQITVNYQAYGLAGLVAFYKATGDSEVLDHIHTLYDGFVSRFQDPQQGGFFDKFNLTTGENNGLKSFNSTVYVATSYLRELVEVEPDPNRKEDYLRLLGKLADIVVDQFVANEMDAGSKDSTGFIRENFNAAWEPEWRDWQKQEVDGQAFTISIVGHNMQVGWFLLEMFERTKIDQYKVAAIATLRSMLERGYDWTDGGVYDAAKREEKDDNVRWMWGTDKAWWQQAETIQALLQADKLGLLDQLDTSKGSGQEALDKTVALWGRFHRPEGGTFQQVRKDGVPIAGPLDNPGKGSYHEAQVADVAVQAGGVELNQLGVERPAAVYAEIQTALEQGTCLKIQPLLDSLAKLGAIDLVDNFGLTISMRAAALGNLEVVKVAHALGASLEVRNPRTNANLLHFAAQAMSGGAEIINWAILRANASSKLLSERILVPDNGRYYGNGHTVTMEARFNGNEEALRTLINLHRSNYDVDLTTHALTCWTPLGFAVRQGFGLVSDLAVAASSRLVRQEDGAWLSQHPDDKAAIDLVNKLRKYVLEDVVGEPIEGLLKSALESSIDVNMLYGRLGQPLLSMVVTHPSMVALQAEQQERYAKVVELLMQNGADPRIKEIAPMGVSAGFRDAVFGYRAALEHIIKRVPAEEHEDFINEQGIMNGYTRISDAAFFGRKDVITLLLDNKADIRIKGFNGRTAYQAAEMYNKRSTGEKIPDEILERLKT